MVVSTLQSDIISLNTLHYIYMYIISFVYMFMYMSFLL